MPIEHDVRRAIADEVSSGGRDDSEAAWEAIERRLDRGRRSRPVARAVALVSAAAVTAALVFLLVRAFDVGGGAPGSEGPTPQPSGASTPAAAIPPVDARVVRRYEVGPTGQVNSLVAGDDGVWVTSYSSSTETDGTQVNELIHVAAGTGRVTSVATLQDVPGWEWGGGGMARGFGSVWVAGWAGEYGESSMYGILQRVDEESGEVTVTMLPARYALDVAVDGDSLWVLANTDREKTHAVIRIDPVTGALVDRVSFEADWVRAMLPISGSVWVSTRETNGNGVGGGSAIRLDPTTGAVVESVRLGGTFTEPVRTDAIWGVRGSSYFPAGTPSHDLVRADPATGEVTGSWSVGTVGYAIAPAPDGAVWLLGSDGGSPAVSRFNPSTGEVDVTVELEGEPVALSVSERAVWILDYDGRITEVGLEPAS